MATSTAVVSSDRRASLSKQVHTPCNKVTSHTQKRNSLTNFANIAFLFHEDVLCLEVSVIKTGNWSPCILGTTL